MFIGVFSVAALLTGSILGWKPLLAIYWVHRLETGERTAAAKLQELGPAAVPHLVGAIARGRQPSAEPQISSLLAGFGPAGEGALLDAYGRNHRNSDCRARLAWALRYCRGKPARTAYHQAILDEQLALYRRHEPIRDHPVAVALWALAARQEDDGRWSGSRWGARGASDTEVTSLASLAFLSYGETRKSGSYSFEVGRALDYLAGCQNQDGLLGSGSMRDHALAGMALAEACNMEGSRTSPLAALAQRAADYTIARQESAGGWANVPGEATDDLTSALCVMQLKSTKLAGLTVTPPTLQAALDYFGVLTIGEDGGPDRHLVRTRAGERPTPRSLACEAIVRWLLGFVPDDPQFARLAGEAGGRPHEFIADPWAGFLGKMAFFLYHVECRQQWRDTEKKLLLPAQTSSGVSYGLWPANSDEGRRLGLIGHTALRAMEMVIGERGEYLPMYTK